MKKKELIAKNKQLKGWLDEASQQCEDFCTEISALQKELQRMKTLATHLESANQYLKEAYDLKAAEVQPYLEANEQYKERNAKLAAELTKACMEKAALEKEINTENCIDFWKTSSYKIDARKAQIYLLRESIAEYYITNEYLLEKAKTIGKVRKVCDIDTEYYTVSPTITDLNRLTEFYIELVKDLGDSTADFIYSEGGR